MAIFYLIIPERDMRVVKISEDAPVDKWFTGEPPTYAEFVRDTPPELRAHPRVTWSPPVDGDFYGTIFFRTLGNISHRDRLSRRDDRRQTRVWRRRCLPKFRRK